MPIVAAGLAFLCTPVAVYDGDGPVWCTEGQRLRIAGIAAREMDGTCRRTQPCPGASAIAARDALVQLLGGPKGQWRHGNQVHIRVRFAALRCVSTGPASGNRTGAWCTLPDGRDLSCAMVATRTVLRWRRYWRGHRCLADQRNNHRGQAREGERGDDGKFDPQSGGPIRRQFLTPKRPAGR